MGAIFVVKDTYRGAIARQSADSLSLRAISLRSFNKLGVVKGLYMCRVAIDSVKSQM